jgi:hypothetical protein
VRPHINHRRSHRRPLVRLCQTTTACSHRHPDVPFHPRRALNLALSVVSPPPIAPCKAATRRECPIATASLQARRQRDPTAATTLPIPCRSPTSRLVSQVNAYSGLRLAMRRHEIHGRRREASPLDRTASQTALLGHLNRKESSIIAL